MIFKHIAVAVALSVVPTSLALADNGLITKRSTHSVSETIAKFEAAINAKAAGGWTVFTKVDHAAAAKTAGLDMKPRVLIIFGNPKGGTPSMTKSATLAIDLPMKALVWQDDEDKVWLSYNSSEYGAKVIFPRHGLSVPDGAQQALEKLLADASEASTQ